MPNAKKPLEPDDFPVNAEEKRSKSTMGHLSLTPTIRLSRPTSPSALTTTKLGAKKISGQLSIVAQFCTPLSHSETLRSGAG
jgi:hypothetical protein